MEQSPPWEAYSLSASQEVPRLLQNTKVHYRVHKNPPSHLIPCFPLIQFNIIHLSMSTSSNWSLPFWLSNQIVRISYLPHACFMPRPSLPLWFAHSNNIWWSTATNYEAPHCAIFSSLSSPFFGLHILFSTLFSNSLNPFSFLDVRDQVRIMRIVPKCIVKNVALVQNEWLQKPRSLKQRASIVLAQRAGTPPPPPPSTLPETCDLVSKDTQQQLHLAVRWMQKLPP
jgi:hypothetical protein